MTAIASMEPACAASGKSGGFLARDWCDGTPLMRLARRSFDLHAMLAAELEGDWGYRRLTTYAGAIGPQRHRGAGDPALGWTRRTCGSTASSARPRARPRSIPPPTRPA